MEGQRNPGRGSSSSFAQLVHNLASIFLLQERKTLCSELLCCPGENITHHPSWKYSHIIAMDGNFKAEHILMKKAANEVWLMDGKGFMVTSEPYKAYLTNSKNWVEVSLHLIRLWCLLMLRSEI